MSDNKNTTGKPASDNVQAKPAADSASKNGSVADDKLNSVAGGAVSDDELGKISGGRSGGQGG